MEVIVKRVTDWQRVVDAARLTSNKSSLGREPNDEWKRKAIKSEHSPIRLLEFDILLKDIPYWVMVHLVRHKIGCEFFVGTQRDDRTDNEIPRAQKPQGALITMQISCNAQALINISRKRLCNKASKETRELWKMVKDEVTKVDPIVGEAMVKECIYRGRCNEMQPCGFPKLKHDYYGKD